MRHRYILLISLGVLAAALAGAACYVLLHRPVVIGDWPSVGRPPRIRPDWADAVIPPNIAPLNFQVEEEGKEYCVKVHGDQGRPFQVASGSPRIEMPLRPWRDLLGANRGGRVYCDAYVRAADGSWRRFETFSASVAAEPIDRYLVYRRINVLYNFAVGMSIRQRDLESFDDSLVIDNKSFDGGCVNCHTFLNNRSDKVIVHMRSGRVDYGAGMLVLENGKVRKVEVRSPFSPKPASFISWHPSGRLVAFSVNKLRQPFHSARTEVRDAVDLDSALAIYNFESKAVSSPRSLSDPDRLETFPAWSADGRYLYFCSAPVLWSDRNTAPPEHFDEVRYSLMRIAYDADKDSWGKLETVISGEKLGKSITLPRPSPDGRYLVFCMADYSLFATFQRSADLYIMDLTTGSYERMDCNSEWSESWHSWSSNSRWLAFSSKRGDGLFIKDYFSYIDKTGKAHKPFVLPQKDPAFYDSWIMLFQLPELSRDPFPVVGEKLAHAIRTGAWERSSLPVTSATPAGKGPRRGAPPEATSTPEPWSAHE